MKKKILAIILCAVMIITALPVMVMPAAATTDAAICTHASATWSKSDQSGNEWSSGVEYKKMACSECNTTVIFEPWTDAFTATINANDSDNGGSNSGVGVQLTESKNYYLIKNVDINSVGLKGATMNLDLNGYTVNLKSLVTSMNVVDNNKLYGLFSLYNSSTLSIYDSSAEKNGALTRSTSAKADVSSNARCMRVDGTSTLNMYGGTITGYGDEGYGPTVGAAVHIASGGKFNMYGGLMTNCVATSGGAAINNATGTVKMYGGTIENCVSPTGVINNSGTITMDGGVIVGAVKGTAVVVNNTSDAHLYGDYCTGTECSVSNCEVNRTAPGHVYSDSNDIKCNICSTIPADHTHSFTWEITDKDGQSWTEGTKYKKATCVCEEQVIFTPWDGTTVLSGSVNVYMTADATPDNESDDYFDLSSRTVRIDLNGYKLTAVDGKRIANLWGSGIIEFYDSVGTGKVIGDGEREPFNLNNNTSVLKIYGGTFVSGSYNTYKLTDTSAAVSLYGGTFDEDVSAKVAANYKAFEINAGSYTVASTADGVVAAAVRVGGNNNSSGIQFKAIFNDDGLNNKGTETANFGVLVISKAKYDALTTKDYASIAAVTGVINAKGEKGIQGDGVYTMLVTINDIAPENYDDELVALKYVNGAIVGDAAVRSVKSVAEMALADPACDDAIKPILNAFIGN